MSGIRKKPRFRKYVRRKKVSFKVRRKFRPTVKEEPKIQNVTTGEKSGLRQQNAHLAFALNQAKEENSCLNQHVSELKDEIIDLRVQLSDLRSKQDEDRSYAERMEEAEFQRRLAEYLEPQKTHLNQALDHICGLSQNLTNALKLASAPGRRSKSTSFSRPLPPPSQQPIQNRGHNRNNTSVAQVIPMVMGHNIHRPKIRIPRLNMNDLNLLMQTNGQVATLQNGARLVTVQEPPGQENQAVPMEANVQDGHAEVNDGDSQDTAEEREEETEEDEEDRPLRRQPRPRRNEPAMEDLLEEEEEEEDEDEEEGHTVLLVPRLVLERVTLSPSQNRRRQSLDRQSLDRQSLDRQIIDRHIVDPKSIDRRKSKERKSIDRRKSIDHRKSTDVVGRRQAAERQQSIESVRTLRDRKSVEVRNSRYSVGGVGSRCSSGASRRRSTMGGMADNKNQRRSTVFTATEATTDEEEEEEASSSQVDPLPILNPGPTSQSAADSTSNLNLRPEALTFALAKTSQSQIYLKPRSNLDSVLRPEHEVQSTPCRARKSAARVSFQLEAPNVSPILVNQTRKSRNFVTAVPTNRRELKVVVSDCRKSVEGLTDGKISSVNSALTTSSGNSDSEAPRGNLATNSTSVNNTSFYPEDEASNVSTENETTAGSGSESLDEYYMSLMAMDPLEGPSWLMDNRGRKRKRKPATKKSSPEVMNPDAEVGKLDVRKPEMVISLPETEVIEEPHSTCNGIEEAEVAAISSHDASSNVENRNITMTCNSTAILKVESRSSTPATSQATNDTLRELKQPPSRADSPLVQEGCRPSKRRAAAAAAGSLREPLLSTKMRRESDKDGNLTVSKKQKCEGSEGPVKNSKPKKSGAGSKAKK